MFYVNVADRLISSHHDQFIQYAGANHVSTLSWESLIVYWRKERFSSSVMPIFELCHNKSLSSECWAKSSKRTCAIKSYLSESSAVNSQPLRSNTSDYHANVEQKSMYRKLPIVPTKSWGATSHKSASCQCWAKDDKNNIPNRGLEPLFPAWEASVITTYTNSDAPAGNRTRGPTMATLDFTTKPLALDDFSKKCLIHKTNKNTHGKIASLLEPALKVQHPNYKSIREVLKWLIMFWNWYHRYLHHHHLLIMSIHSR